MPDEHVEEIGLRFKADGTADYIGSLKMINAEMQTIYQEYVRGITEMDKDATATEKLTAKKNMLEKQLESQGNKVALLRKELQNMEKDENADTLAVEKKKKELAYAETQLARYEKQLEDTNEELKKHKEATDKAAASLKKNGEVLVKIGDKVSAVSDKIIDFGKDTIKTTADFDTSMSQVKAVSGATEDEFEKLRKKAREMGAQTKFSASEAADAMNYMAMAGWKTDDMLEGIAGIMNLAAASGENLATTSDIVTDALTALGYEAKDAGRLADVMAAASSNANTNVAMMGETFKYAAAVCGSMGYSMEDVAVATGLMANSGIKASQAGTSLRSIITRLANPTKHSAAAMDALGIEIADESGHIYTLRELMDQLRETMGGGALSQEEFGARLAGINEKLGSGELTMSEYMQRTTDLDEKLANGSLTTAQYEEAMAKLDQEVKEGMIVTTGSYDEALSQLMTEMYGLDAANKVQYAAMLAGKNAMTGLLAIVNATDADYQKLTSAVDNASQTFVQTKDGAIIPLSQALTEGKETVAQFEGEAARMSAVMQDNLNGQLTILDSQLSELKISLGDLLMPLIREAVTVCQNIVNWLNGLDEGQKKIIITIGLLVAALGPLLVITGKTLIGLGDLIEALPKIQSGIAAVSKSFSGFTALIAAHPIVAGITAAIAALVLLYNKCEWFRNGVNAIFEKVKGIFLGVTNYVSGAFRSAWETAWTGCANVLGTIFGSVAEMVKVPINAVISIVNGAINGINSLRIDIPKWVPKLGGQHFGLDIKPIPLLASGGRLLNGMAVVAEAGPELLSQQGTRTTVTPLGGGSAQHAAQVGLDDATIKKIGQAFAAAVSQMDLGISVGEREFGRLVRSVT